MYKRQLLKMRRGTEEILNAMEKEYSQNHRKLAENIFREMIGDKA